MADSKDDNGQIKGTGIDYDDDASNTGTGMNTTD